MFAAFCASRKDVPRGFQASMSLPANDQAAWTVLTGLIDLCGLDSRIEECLLIQQHHRVHSLPDGPPGRDHDHGSVSEHHAGDWR